jgi:hypothetical protein
MKSTYIRPVVSPEHLGLVPGSALEGELDRLPNVDKEMPEGPPEEVTDGVRGLTPDAASVGGNDQVTCPLPPELSPKKDSEGVIEGTHVVTTTVGVIPHVKHRET